MIKHVIFTDEALAKVFCYDLAKTLSHVQQRTGTIAYSSVTTHPLRTASFAVMVDDSDKAAVDLVNRAAYSLVSLDSTWYPEMPLP